MFVSKLSRKQRPKSVISLRQSVLLKMQLLALHKNFNFTKFFRDNTVLPPTLIDQLVRPTWIISNLYCRATSSVFQILGFKLPDTVPFHHSSLPITAYVSASKKAKTKSAGLYTTITALVLITVILAITALFSK